MDDLASVLTALRGLIKSLDTSAARDPAALGKALSQPAMVTAFQTVLAHLSVARRLRLFGWLSQVDFPAGANPIPPIWDDAPGTSDPNPGLLLRRSLQHLHRADCLGRIFAADRVAYLHSLCQDDT